MKVMFLNEKGRRGRVCGSQMKVMFLNEKGRRGHSDRSISVFYSHHVFQSHFGNLKHEYLFIHHVILEKGLV